MPRTQLSFASFNLYNLNLPGKPMYKNQSGWSVDQYNKKISWSAERLLDLQPDVVGFQELWHEDALHDILKKASLETYYDVLTPLNHDGNRIVCAAVVRKGLLQGTAEWLVKFPDKYKLESSGDDPQTPDISISIDSFSRPALRFQIKPHAQSTPISLYVVHLKSKAPTEIYREGWYRGDKDYYSKHSENIGYTLSTLRRSAEASALRMVIVDQIKDNDQPVVVLGDLNDGQLSNTLNIITGQPNYLMSALSRGGSDTDLYTVATLQELRSLRDVYYTHIHQNIKESLDHIVVSQEFYDQSSKRVWAFKGMQISNDHLNVEEHKENGTTDHGIVKATFEYFPEK